MDTPPRFPLEVEVTGQFVSCAELSPEARAFVVTFTEGLARRYRESGKDRMIVGLAGPSGVGKSFLAALAAALMPEIAPDIPFRNVSIDAFHFPNAYLETHTDGPGLPLRAHKGRFDTFDVELLRTKLEAFRAGERVAFPLYSRAIHDPIADMVECGEPRTLLLLEGLWILREENGWGSIAKLLDHSYYLDDDPRDCERHAIHRHIRGGREPDDARKWYQETDLPNAAEVAKTKERADEVIVWSS